MKKYLLLALSFFINSSLIGGTKNLSECTSDDVCTHLMERIQDKDHDEITNAFGYQKYMDLIPSEKIGDLLITVARCYSSDILTVLAKNIVFSQMLKNLSEEKATEIFGYACYTSIDATNGFLTWEEFKRKLPKESADEVFIQELTYEVKSNIIVLLNNEFIVNNISPIGIKKAKEYADNIGSQTYEHRQIKDKINELLKTRWKEILTNSKLSTDL